MPDSILVLPDSIGVIGEQPEIWWQKTRPKEEKRRAYLPALISASCREWFFGNADVHAVWPKVPMNVRVTMHLECCQPSAWIIGLSAERAVRRSS